MPTLPKYTQHRSEIQHGDIVLFRGKGPISKCIQWLDKSHYSHIGLVFTAGGRLLVLDSNGPGVHPDFLSLRMAGGRTDFCILRPKFAPSDIDHALGIVMDKAQKGIKYDFLLVVQIALYRLGSTRQIFQTNKRDICSEFIRRYTDRLLNNQPNCFTKPNLPTDFITPWDYILYADAHFDILFDDSNKNKYRKP